MIDARGATPGAARTVAECVDAPAHAGRLEGALRVGHAAADGRIVTLGVFADGRARFRASACASLIAYAEVACEALEAGIAPATLDAALLRGRVRGVHPGHLERAALVADAVRAAFPSPAPLRGASEVRGHVPSPAPLRGASEVRGRVPGEP